MHYICILRFKWVILFIFLLLSLVVCIGHSYGQVNTWVKINKGFDNSPCPGISEGTSTDAVEGNFAMANNTTTIINKDGFAYAFIDPQNGCETGLFKFDTLASKWNRVANTPVFYQNQKIGLYTNNYDILSITSGGQKQYISILTSDYANYPSGWKFIAATPPITDILSTCGSGYFYKFGSYGQFSGTYLVGDTLYGITDYINCVSS